jgi:hypothetical protein
MASSSISVTSFSDGAKNIIKFAGVYIMCLRIPVGVYHDSLLKKLRKYSD